MSELTPCPECQRHVRKTETTCPFCGEAVSLADVASPVLPRRRLSRAATFAFGASVVGATTLGACTLEDPGNSVAVYGAPPSAGAGGNAGGSSSPVYGSPPSGGTSAGTDSGGTGGAPPASGGADDGGAPASAGAGGAAAGGEGAGGEGGYGSDFAVYGSPPGNSGTGGTQ
jgi:hypothetical protein